MADGSSWRKVIPILQERGHNVVAVQLGLKSLAEDVAWTKHVLAERLQGPTVLGGHSYGGAVPPGTGRPTTTGADGGHFIWAEVPAEYASTILDSITSNSS
jgi:hypothetical protein